MRFKHTTFDRHDFSEARPVRRRSMTRRFFGKVSNERVECVSVDGGGYGALPRASHPTTCHVVQPQAKTGAFSLHQRNAADIRRKDSHRALAMSELHPLASHFDMAWREHGKSHEEGDHGRPDQQTRRELPPREPHARVRKQHDADHDSDHRCGDDHHTNPEGRAKYPGRAQICDARPECCPIGLPPFDAGLLVHAPMVRTRMKA